MKDASIESIRMELNAAHKSLNEKMNKLQQIKYEINNVIKSLKSLDNDLKYASAIIEENRKNKE